MANGKNRSKKQEPRPNQISYRCSDTQYNFIKKMADKDNRSMTYIIEEIIGAHIKGFKE